MSFVVPVADDEEGLRYMTYMQLVSETLQLLEKKVLKTLDECYDYRAYYKMQEIEPSFMKITFFIPVDKTKYFYFCPKWRNPKPDFSKAFKRAEEELLEMTYDFCEEGHSLIVRNSSGEITILANNEISEEVREVIYE